MTRAVYILLRFAEMVISSNSRLYNAVIHSGSTHQTTSARARHLANRGRIIAHTVTLRDFPYMPRFVS